MALSDIVMQRGNQSNHLTGHPQKVFHANQLAD
jgi:hypothetical protein